MESAFAAMRTGQNRAAVQTLADAFVQFLELHPSVMSQTIAMRGRDIPRIMRWPDLGARLIPESVREGKPRIEIDRERFSASEAMTYYQFVLEEILEFERRAM
ncbi:MAG TPA: hypothetical protein VGG92_07035 [Caulobacteraceae bacterium]